MNQDSKRSKSERSKDLIGRAIGLSGILLLLIFLGYMIVGKIRDPKNIIVGEVQGKIVGLYSTAGDGTASDDYLLYVALDNGGMVNVYVHYTRQFKIGGRVILYRTVSERYKHEGYQLAKILE